MVQYPSATPMLRGRKCDLQREAGCHLSIRVVGFGRRKGNERLMPPVQLGDPVRGYRAPYEPWFQTCTLSLTGNWNGPKGTKKWIVV